MAVTRSCDPGDVAVAVDIAAGQRLVYRVTADDPEIPYRLMDLEGTVLLAGPACGNPCVRGWLEPNDDVPAGDKTAHTLAMQFLRAGTIRYDVELHAADGTVIRAIKRCAFANDDEPDDFYEPLTIFLE